jgi:hypothetical protein
MDTITTITNPDLDLNVDVDPGLESRFLVELPPNPDVDGEVLLKIMMFDGTFCKIEVNKDENIGYLYQILEFDENTHLSQCGRTFGRKEKIGAFDEKYEIYAFKSFAGGV